MFIAFDSSYKFKSCKSAYAVLYCIGSLLAPLPLSAENISSALPSLLPGDVSPRIGADKRVDLADYIAIQRHILGIERLSHIGLRAADVAPMGLGNGIVDNADLLIVGQIMLGKISANIAPSAPPPRSDTASTSYTYQFHDAPANTRVSQRIENGPRQDLVVDDITTSNYDLAGNLVSVENSLGQVTRLENYNLGGQVGSITGPNGVTTALQYHPRGWITRINVSHPFQPSLDAITRFEYDKAGRLSKVMSPDGEFLLYGYDLTGRMSSIQNTLGERIEYQLDAAGNQLSEVICTSGAEPESVQGCAVVRSKQQIFDGINRLRKTLDSSNNSIAFDYDSNGNTERITDGRGNVSTYTFDSLNRLSRQVQPDDTPFIATDSPQINTSYDTQGRIRSITDQRGLTTHYEYDSYGDLVQIDSPDQGHTYFTYDNVGNRTSQVDARGQVTYYRYDALNRLTHVIALNAPEENVVYIYDDTGSSSYGAGKLSHIYDQSGVTSYAYDHRGNVVQKTVVIGDAQYLTRYTYTVGDKLQSITYPSGMHIDYERDIHGQVTAVSQNQSGLLEDISYQPFGPIKAYSMSNGVSRKAGFDASYRLSGIVDAGTTNILDVSYTYDANSNIVAINDALSPVYSQNFSYQPNNRLESATGAYGLVTYSYDKVGNRTERGQLSPSQGLTETYAYAIDSNRLEVVTQAEGGQSATRQLAYDAAGNTISDAKFDSENYSLAYNASNRFSSLKIDGINIATYQHNALGQRVFRQSDGEVLHYHYDEAGRLLALGNPDGTMRKEFIYVDHSRVARVVTSNGNRAIEFIHNDHLGRPVALTNSEQQVVWRARYLPFGEVEVVVNTTEDQELGFPGQVLDRESGFWYNYFRDYDPNTGRYIQADRLDLKQRSMDPQILILGFEGLGWFAYNGKIYFDNESSSSTNLNHLYGYANQNPIGWTDWNGLAPGQGGRGRSSAAPAGMSGSIGDQWSLSNGNFIDDFAPQDNRCSVPIVGALMDMCVLDRCQRHDKCFEENKCNQSSIASSLLGGTKKCNQCNSGFFN